MPETDKHTYTTWINVWRDSVPDEKFRELLLTSLEENWDTLPEEVLCTLFGALKGEVE